MGELHSLDPVSEDATNAQVSLEAPAGGIECISYEFPTPEDDNVWVTTPDTDGERKVSGRPRNRRIPIVVRCFGPQMRARLADVTHKVGKIRAERGTYQRVLTDGTAHVFDVETVHGSVPSAEQWWLFQHKDSVEFALELECRPYWRKPYTQLADHTETTLPQLVFVEDGQIGDVDSLARLVVDDDSANDQWFLYGGVRSRHYSSAATNKLFYEAEDLTPLGTAAANAGPAGASGGGANKTILQGSLTPSFAAVLSTQAAGGGAHLTHIGEYVIWARVWVPTTNTGAVDIAFEWAAGDFRRRTRNDPVALYPDADSASAWGGTWRRIKLGHVSLSKAVQGSQRWEGRLLARSTVAGDDIYVDYIQLVPSTEGYFEISAVQQFETVTSFSARDEFDQADGVLTGKTAPVGGTWALGTGDADDFEVEADRARRQATADGGVGRIEVLGATNYAATLVQADVYFTGTLSNLETENLHLGVVARYVGASNYLRAYVSPAGVFVKQTVAGTVTTLGSVESPKPLIAAAPGQGVGAHSLRILIDAGGRWFLWYWLTGTDPPLLPIALGQQADLATGGALASGKPGLVDFFSGAESITRAYDNFVVATPTTDAAIFASQSLEMRSDGVIREDPTGSFWNHLTPEGDLVTMPAAWEEARDVEFFVSACRNDPYTMADPAIDDISGRLWVAPRGLVVPES